MAHTRKIVIAAEIFPPEIGGPATYAQKLAEALTQEGHTVEVLTYGKKKEQLKNVDYILHVSSNRVPLPFRYFIYAWKLFWAARDADVVYAQGPLSAGFPSLLVKRVLGVRLVVKVVGDQAWERARQNGKTQLLLDDFHTQVTSGKIKSIQNIQRDVLTQADAIITVSNWFGGIMAKWGIDLNKVSVIHNAVSPLAASQDTPVDGDVILSVGRLTEWKGYKKLIEVMPELLKVNANFKLVIVGEGPEQDYLHQLVNSMQLSNEVIFTGKLTKEALAAYYRSAKIFVLNSGYENWSHVLVEAMHAGLPIVASSEGGNPETVQQGELGVLVEYNNAEEIKNAVIDLWNNPQKRETLGKKAQQYAQGYTFADMYEKTKEILFLE